ALRARCAEGVPEGFGSAPAPDVQRLDRGVPADAAELVAHERMELGPVAVRVDDGMLEAVVKLAGLGLRVDRHGAPPWHSVTGWMIPPSPTTPVIGARRADPPH